jgi:hypothetical protein
MIVRDAPLDTLTTSLVHPDAQSNPMTALFRSKTYGRIVRAINAEEKQVKRLNLIGEDKKSDALALLAFLRLQVYQSLACEINLLKQGRQFTSTVIPTNLDEGARYINPDTRIQVWARATNEGEQPTLLGEEDIRSGESYVREFSEAVHRLLEAHCDLRKLMRLRFRSAWWTKRPSPSAFPVVTKYLIPRLYDCLKPYYHVREYVVSPTRSGPAAFPRDLSKDIAEILRLECPALCRTLTWVSVQASIKRYLDMPTTRPDRRMGYEMFRVWPQDIVSKSQEGKPPDAG